jgi:PAS domain S-box-containing protein
VRSLMAVPVMSRSGRVMGALVVGSGEPSAFGPIDERLSAGIAAQTAVAIDNARLYRAAQESDQRFRQLAENVSDVFWMYESPGIRLIYVSPAYETIWGRSCQSLFEDFQTFTDSIHPDDRDRVLGVFCPRDQGETTAEEFRIIRPDGSIRWIWDRGFPIKDKAGRVVRVAGIAEDITERKASEEALRESDRRKTEFIAMLSHELRNPLAPIRNALDLIKHRPAAVETGEFADDLLMIERQVVHMTRLIDDLLDISRISRGKIPIRRQTVDLPQLVDRVIATIRPFADKARHELTVTLPPPEQSISLSADPTRLEQILGNLLNNAIKYTDPGGKIGLAVLVEGAFAAIRIRDSGIGIPRGLLPQVFDTFVQGLDHGDRAQGGLGIGLSLVRSLVEVHGGTISAWSDGPGLGSEFIVRLPLLPEPAITPEPSPPVSSPTPSLSDDRPGRHRVLVVDDNHDVATSLVRVLTRVWGQEVRVAHDGPSAVEVAVEFQPELVLLDIGLPGMSGYDVARTLRGRPEFEATRLVALTGWGQDEDRRKSTEAGFDHHMVKPIEPRVLGELVAGLDVGVLP